MDGSIVDLGFTSCRQPAVTVIPAAPNPSEMKRLSNIDNQELLRFQIAYMFIFRCNKAVGSKKDPAPLIRDLLRARDPPQPCFSHNEYDSVPETEGSPNNLVLRTFLFGRRDISALRGLLPPSHRWSTSTFDLLSACLWNCRTAALSPEANQEMRILSTVNARGCKERAGIPKGYYGNAFVTPAAISTASKLCGNPVSYAVELIGKAKAKVDMEYLRSVADLTALCGGPSPAKAGTTFIVSDVTMASRADLDFGWGNPGPADVGGSVPWMSSFFLALKDANGEEGIGVPIRSPRPAMDKFVEEIGEMLLSPPMVAVSAKQPKSAL